jgi:hypothetical protein
MAKTPVFWGLDVEDSNNPQSDDALLRLCQIHAEAGIPLNLFFCRAEGALRSSQLPG